jgi:hypothetical protein
MTALLALILASPSFGIVVGHNGALGDGRADLRFADDDAVRMHALLEAGGVATQLLTTLDADSQENFPDALKIAQPPTLSALERAAATVRDQVNAAIQRGEKPTVYFFYSGHGEVQGGEGQVGLAGGRLRRRDLYRLIINGIPAHRTHVIIDACKSYFLVGGRGPSGRVTPYHQAFARPKAPPGVGFILSTSADADSHEWAALPGGIFSHEVRSGLVGAADANADGAVEYTELAAFVGLANRTVPLPQFRPQVFIRPPAADARAPIFTPGRMRSASTLALPAEATGRLSIRDARGMRYADAHKAATHPLKIALLAPHRYSIRWRDSVLELTADGQPRQLADAKPVVETVAARSAAHRAFEHLFGAPFNASVVDGYRLGLADAVPPPPESDPWTPVWVGTGSALLVGAGVLGFFALDAQVEAGQAPQAERADLNQRTQVLGWSATGAATAGLFALGVALYRSLDAP